MNTALHRLLLLLLLVLPWAAQAGDAADYAKASPAKQARLLESWAAAPAPERLPLIEALRANRVAIDQNKTPFIEENGAYRALEGDAEPVGTPKKLRLNNRLRGLLNTALASHQLFAEDPHSASPRPSACSAAANRNSSSCFSSAWTPRTMPPSAKR